MGLTQNLVSLQSNLEVKHKRFPEILVLEGEHEFLVEVVSLCDFDISAEERTKRGYAASTFFSRSANQKVLDAMAGRTGHLVSA